MSLTTINEKKPLIHCITNYVAANFQANGLLAVGASPIMSDAIEEIPDLINIADGLLINIGTLNQYSVHAMLAAGIQANLKGIPVVLDPVGVGASTFRMHVVAELLAKIKFTVIRCNQSELAAIAGIKQLSRGVDASVSAFDIKGVAHNIASKYGTLVAVSGNVDIIADDKNYSEIMGGHPWMEKVTGAGCLLSALCTAAVVSSPLPFQAIVDLHKQYKEVAQFAYNEGHQLGDFQTSLLNQLHLYSLGGKNI